MSDAAATLRRHLAWSEGPWLGFVFAPSAAAAERLRTALDDGDPVTRVAPRTPHGLRTALPSLLDRPDPSRLLWVEAVHDEAPSDPPGPWTEAWDWLLLRANERRQQLLEAASGWLFVLPSSARGRVREAAPDLWSARALLLELPDAPGVREVPHPPPDPVAPLRHEAQARLEQGWAAAAAEAAERWLDAAGSLPAPQRAREQALAWEHLARAHRALGESPAARASAVQAVAAWRGLGDEPDDELASVPTGLARCLSLLGEMQAEADDLDTADALHREALSLRQARAARSDDPETLADLATSWSMLGDLALRRGNPEWAANAFGEAVHLRRRLVDATGALRHRRLLSVALGRQGRALCIRGQRRQGVERLREADALAQGLQALEPGHVGWRMEAAVARTRLAAGLADRAPDEALALLADAVEVQRDLVDQEPDNARWADQLATSEALLAQIVARRDGAP